MYDSGQIGIRTHDQDQDQDTTGTHDNRKRE